MKTFQAIFSISMTAIAIVYSQVSAAADVALKRESQEIFITAQVQEDFAGTEANVTAPDAGTVEVRFPGADFMVDGKRQLFRFDDENVRTVSVSRDASDGVIRFNVKGINGTAAADQLQIVRGDGRIRVILPVELTPVLATANGTAVRIATINETSGLAASLPATVDKATEKVVEPVAEAVAPAAVAAPAAAPVKMKAEVDKRPESEIPVFASGAAEKKQASSGIERLVITLFVLCVVLAAAIFGLKKWAVRRKTGTQSATKIQVLTQHYLGPKKSLAIIQVAGEAVLIGITDQNISMLKTLSLIDDEVPGLVPKNFSDQLDQEGFEGEEEVSENFAMKGLGEVRDIVNTRFPFGRGSGKSV